jgi:hypothetical protein
MLCSGGTQFLILPFQFDPVVVEFLDNFLQFLPGQVIQTAGIALQEIRGCLPEVCAAGFASEGCWLLFVRCRVWLAKAAVSIPGLNFSGLFHCAGTNFSYGQDIEICSTYRRFNKRNYDIITGCR